MHDHNLCNIFKDAGQRKHASVSLYTGLFILTLLLSGCMLGPNYQRPGMDLPDQYHSLDTSMQEASSSDASASGANSLSELSRWWTVFDDAVLTSLIERAVENNLDLQLAEARILEARAANSEVASGLGPTIDASGAYSRNRSGKTVWEQNGLGAAPTETTEAQTSDLYSASFDAAWELDFFGGTRRSIEAAGAELEASVESRRDVLVTLTAEVAKNYIELRTCQQRAAIAELNLASQTRNTDLIRRKHEGGFASALDVAAAEAQEAAYAAELPIFEASIGRKIHKLGILLGETPDALLDKLSPEANIPIAPASIPAGVPSDLLQRRPDIRQAEAQVHAETARIGAMTSELFPKITITGGTGYKDDALNELLNSNNLFWSIGPSIEWNLFSSGRTTSKIDRQKAVKEQVVITYRQTVLSALLEVEDGLISIEKERTRRQRLREAVSANRKTVSLAERQYMEGRTDFFNVLTAQRTLYASKDALVESTGVLATHMVVLYKALGGGWEDMGTSE